MYAILSQRPSVLAAGSVQLVQDQIVPDPLGIHIKNLADNMRLGLIDYIFATLNIISQWRRSAEKCSLFGFLIASSNGLLPGIENLDLPHTGGQQLQEKIISISQVAQVLSGRNDFDAYHHHLFAKRKPVAYITRAPCNIVDYHRFKLVPSGRRKETLKARAICVSPRLRFVSVHSHNVDIIHFTVFTDLCQLVCDRVFCLLVRAIAGVGYGVHTHFTSLYSTVSCANKGRFYFVLALNCC